MKKLLVFFCIGISLPGFSQEKRLALVIGNSAYEHGGVLKNPVNDAELMAKTLEELDFDVIKKLNATKNELDDAILDFWRKQADYSVSLFYYAGHGVQVDGINYLLPIDAELEDELALRIEAIDVNEVVSQFGRFPNNINIVILDACRDDPFRTWVRSGSAGFAAMPAPSGTLIAFATAPGATASDGRDGNGLYTLHLTQQLIIPQRIEDVFINTRVKVRYASGGKQNPQEWSQLTGRFSFVIDLTVAEPDQSQEIEVQDEEPGYIIPESKVESSGITYEKGFLSSVKIYKDGNRIKGNEILDLYSSNKQAINSFQWARVKVGGAIVILPWGMLSLAGTINAAIEGNYYGLVYGASAVGSLTASFLLCRWARHGRVKALNSYYDNYQGLSISSTHNGIGLVYTF